jgi:hypothetical protein
MIMVRFIASVRAGLRHVRLPAASAPDAKPYRKGACRRSGYSPPGGKKAVFNHSTAGGAAETARPDRALPYITNSRTTYNAWNNAWKMDSEGIMEGPEYPRHYPPQGLGEGPAHNWVKSCFSAE